MIPVGSMPPCSEKSPVLLRRTKTGEIPNWVLEVQERAFLDRYSCMNLSSELSCLLGECSLPLFCKDFTNRSETVGSSSSDLLRERENIMTGTMAFASVEGFPCLDPSTHLLRIHECLLLLESKPMELKLQRKREKEMSERTLRKYNHSVHVPCGIKIPDWDLSSTPSQSQKQLTPPPVPLLPPPQVKNSIETTWGAGRSLDKPDKLQWMDHIPKGLESIARRRRWVRVVLHFDRRRTHKLETDRRDYSKALTAQACRHRNLIEHLAEGRMIDNRVGGADNGRSGCFGSSLRRKKGVRLYANSADCARKRWSPVRLRRSLSRRTDGLRSAPAKALSFALDDGQECAKCTRGIRIICSSLACMQRLHVWLLVGCPCLGL
ncbi:hypothetical protein H6P81_016691 [Aristolochia fimbriata]|uniref:Uncharacterized protein n=1 Tax=Aristolochia fimbriata TaxID=158543 RepID=A0AAV7EC49_ARIFI|nr:hypothetical protein H6P81_016691 [Aristolochia fimbriata]